MTKYPLNRLFDCDPAPAKPRRPAPINPVSGRPVFRAPELCNPRVVFDPLPFHTQTFWTPRPHAGGR